MRFSIRELLALAVIAALGMMAWQSRQALLKLRDRKTALATDVETLAQELWIANPQMHQATLSTIDSQVLIGTLRERSIRHVKVLEEKYGGIEPRGEDVLSLRSVPAIEVDNVSPMRFRIYVPKTRETWLKFGVHATSKSTHSSRGSDDEADLLTQSPFERSGPYELRLRPGERLLEILTGDNGDMGSVPVTIVLDNKTLLETAYVSPGARRGGYSAISAQEQIDFDRKRRPPWLTSISIRLPDAEPGKPIPTYHAFSLWISDRTSKFAEFPGE